MPDCLRSTAVTERERERLQYITDCILVTFYNQEYSLMSGSQKCLIGFSGRNVLFVDGMLVHHRNASNPNVCVRVTFSAARLDKLIRTKPFLVQSRGYENQRTKSNQSCYNRLLLFTFITDPNWPLSALGDVPANKTH